MLMSLVVKMRASQVEHQIKGALKVTCDQGDFFIPFFFGKGEGNIRERGYDRRSKGRG